MCYHQCQSVMVFVEPQFDDWIGYQLPLTSSPRFYSLDCNASEVESLIKHPHTHHFVLRLNSFSITEWVGRESQKLFVNTIKEHHMSSHANKAVHDQQSRRDTTHLIVYVPHLVQPNAHVTRFHLRVLQLRLLSIKTTIFLGHVGEQRHASRQDRNQTTQDLECAELMRHGGGVPSFNVKSELQNVRAQHLTVNECSSFSPRQV